jgi:hypothetical protein
MSPILTLSTVLAYFALLFVVAWWTGRGANEHSFFIGNRNSNWLVVAYGMIGTSLSGVTFMSVPGKVGVAHFAYMQVALGYLLGYWVVAGVLLPLYYRMNLTSIYHYLLERFGNASYKTGALLFIVSRTMGATLRLYLVVNVLQIFILDTWQIPFWVTAAVVILMILLYTFQGGVKTIVWTDLLQTTFMLLALVICIVFIKEQLGLNWGGFVEGMRSQQLTKIWNMEWGSKGFFLKQVLGGAFITIAMTGLDQEMMQKNISVKNLSGAQRNMLSFSGVLVVVNLLFLILGAALFMYAKKVAMPLPTSSDDLFPSIALHYLPPAIGLIFLIGLISALFPSADGAITALTASFCIDILGLQRRKDLTEQAQKSKRLRVHLSFALLFYICVLIFKVINEKAIIDLLLDIAGYTYGPLLGLFSFGILTKRRVIDARVPYIALLSPLLCYALNYGNSQQHWLGNYQIGLELLIINGAFTFIGLWLFASGHTLEKPVDIAH